MRARLICSFSLMDFITGRIIAAKIPIIAMTTSSSTRVKALWMRIETGFDFFMEKLFPLVWLRMPESTLPPLDCRVKEHCPCVLDCLRKYARHPSLMNSVPNLSAWAKRLLRIAIQIACIFLIAVAVGAALNRAATALERTGRQAGFCQGML